MCELDYDEHDYYMTSGFSVTYSQFSLLKISLMFL